MSLGDLSIGIKLRLDNRELDGKLELSRAQLRKFAADMRSAASASAGAFSATRTALKSVSSQLAEVRNALLGYFSIMQAARGAAAIVEAASAMQQLSARLKIATADARDFAAAQTGVFEIANRYGASVDETARSFARLNPVIRQMGGGSAETLKMLDGLAASLKLSGATAAETSAVLLQFSQAMGSGRVGGDELRSMMENAEPLMRAVAEQMGKTTGELRQMAEQGQLTSAAFGNALLPAIDKLRGQAEQVPLGLSQSMQVLRNELSRAFGREFESQSTALGEAIRGLAAHADAAARAVRVLADALVFIVQKAAILISGAALGGLMIALGGVAGAARAAMSALSAFNTVAAGIVMGAVLQRLEKLSRVGKMGLLGMVFFGAYELTDWLINLANAREKITDLLTPVFKLVDKMRGIDRQAEAQAAASAAAEKSRQTTAAPLKRLADPSAFARLTQDLAYETRLRAKHKQELLELEQAYQDKLATLRDERSRAAFAREYQEARRELLLKQKQEMEGILSRRLGAVTRLPQLVESFDAELAALKAHLKTAEDMLEAAFRARLVKEDAYWQAKGEMQRRALDLEARDLQRQMADQQRLIDALAKMRPKDENQRQEIDERIQQAKNKLAELQVKMGEIDGRRMVVDLEVRSNLERARQELEDLKAGLRERIAEATGEMTPEMRRAAIERANRELLEKMAGDAEGEALVRRMIDVEAAKAEMADLESAWRLALETMRNAETSVNIQREQGLITTAEAQARIAEAHRQAAAELEAILPRLDAVAKVLGPEAAARVAAFRNELAQVGQVVDPIAASLNTTFKDAFAAMFEQIGSGAKTAKEAFTDFARSVLSSIQRILSQRLAEQLFSMMGGSGGGIGGFFSGLFKWLGFASGGYVSGPGTSTSDSIPARLSAGEYVIRAEAVRRVAYHLHRSHPGDGSLAPMSGTGASAGGLDTVRVGASEVIHLFRPLRPGQIRGEPWLARVLVKLNELDQYDDAELVRKKTAAMFAGFITRLAPEDTLMGEGLPDPQGAALAGLEPGTLQILAPGEDIKFSAPADVGASYGEFMRQQLRAVAAAMGITYEMLTGDLTQVNYSSIRAGLLEFRRRCEAIQHGVIVHQLCCPVWRAWMEQAVLEGALSLPGYARRRRAYQAAKWIPQGWQWVDPLKEFNALKLAIRAGLMSRSEAISAYGYDAEDIDREIASDNRRADSLGLVFDSDPRHDQGVATIAAQANASDSER